tara:strand:+ start:3772 stop:5490 length:1719 start_codon:yes stop_codon:yes gene_type:complete
MATPQSKIFKKAQAGNFKSILKKQKEQESDPKFAISDSLQEFQSQLETSAGYTNQMKLDKANIRQDIVNFVIDYTVSDLDQLKGMDYDDAKTQQQTTEKSIKEFEGLYNKGVLNDEEIIYIKETVGKTNAELKKILGVATKLSLSFRDFKKELKPLKLAKRIGLTNVPIIGKKIERAIESEDRAEARGLQMKRQLRRKSAKADIKSGSDTSAPQPMEGSPDDKEDLAKRATAGSLGMDLSMPGLGGDGEERVEEERESDKQFGISSNLLEKIYEESKLTNELLGNNEKKSSGLLGGIAASLLAGGAIGTALAALRTSMIARFTTLGSTLKNAFGLPNNKINQKNNRGMINQANDKSTKTNNKVRSTTGSRVGAVGSTMTGNQLKSSMKTNTLVSANKKKGINVAGKFAKNAVRAGGRLLWPVAAIMGAFDAASGVANAGELLDKEDGELTTRDKASAGFAGFLSGLTFGLVDKEKTAKYLAGDREPVEIDNSLETRKKYRHGMRTDQTKLDTVEELKADKIDKLSIGEGTTGNTIINNNVDSSNTTNKTEYGSTNIGTKNADSTVTDYSNIN